MAEETRNQTGSESSTENDTDVDVSATVDEHTQVIEATQIQDVVDYLTTLVEEARLVFTEDALEVKTVDPANVGMTDLSLNSEAFEVYNSIEELGVNLTKMAEILDIADNDTLVVMRFDPEQAKLHFSFDGLEYTLALLDPETLSDEPDVPSADESAEVAVESEEIVRGVSAANMLSDHVTFRADSEREVFVIEAQGDTDDVSVELTEDDYVTMQSPEDASTMYSLDYLTDMLNPISSSSLLTLTIGDDFPLHINFTFSDGEGTVKYVLAPRIQN